MGESGHNLKIARSRLGIRLPFEQPGIGNGYAASGQCISRQMTDEERARYGPARPRKKDCSPFHARILQAVKVCRSPEEAADLLHITVAQLNRYLGFKNICPRWGKEAENVEDFENYEITALKTDPVPEELAKDALREPKYYGRISADKLAEAEQKLSREEYIKLKGEGVTDRKIAKERRIHSEKLVAIKKKWGVADMSLPKGAHKKAPFAISYLTDQGHGLLVAADAGDCVLRHSPLSPSQPAGMTVARALELRTELAEDIASLNRIIELLGSPGEEVTERVYKMLICQRDVYQQELDRLNEALEKTVVRL